MIITGTNVKIQLATGIDLSSATSPKILYENPNGVSGEWDATISGQNIEYTTATTDITISNLWKFQAQVTIGGNIYKGQIATMYIQESL